MLRWVDEQPVPTDPGQASWVDWYEFVHPQFGLVELGGWNELHSWTNPPPHRLLGEVDAHADFAVSQALAAPQLDIAHTAVTRLGVDDGTPVWQIDVGVANVGWLPTYVTERAKRDSLVLPIEVELGGLDRTDVLDGPVRRLLGQLEGALAARFDRGGGGSPERGLVSFTVRVPGGTEVTVEARHQRAGVRSTTITLG